MKKHYKIAMVAACPFPYSRGTPIRIFRMAEALSARGHDVNVITYHLGKIETEVPFKIYRTQYIRNYQKYSPGPNFQKLIVLDPLLTIKLYNFVNHNDVDVIHAHNYEGLVVSLLIRQIVKIPVIYDAHTLLESELPYYKLGLSQKVVKLVGLYLDHWLPPKADHIISVTEKIKQKLIQDSEVIPENITTVMNGVEDNHFNIIAGNNRLSLKRKKILIFTGNLAPYQGIGLLLQAFQQVLHQFMNVRLLIISDSPFDDYENLANALNIYYAIDVLPSNFSTLPKYLASADVALNPRIECDGIPQKLLNYMAAGKPIVSFESSGKILINECTGLVVQDGNIPSFAKAIIQLLNNDKLAKELGENARIYAKLNYSWNNAAEIVEAVYDQVLSKRATQFEYLKSMISKCQ